MFNSNDSENSRRWHSLYRNAVTFAVISLVSVITWAMVGANTSSFWPIWVIGGLTIALLWQWLSIFVSSNRPKN